MCLILFANRTRPDFELILAANRDEYYERPSSPPHFWEEAPHVLAGRDLVAGGTWLGITREGRFGAITNYRDPASFLENAPSRGRLVSDFLLGQEDPLDYLENLRLREDRYNGFNIVLGNRRNFWWYSNRDGRILNLSPGLYGVSNRLLDTPWPKVVRGKERMAEILKDTDAPSPEDLFQVLQDRRFPPDEELPATGVDVEWEKVLSPIFIQSPIYGTRSSTLLFITSEGRVSFLDRTFDSSPEPLDSRSFEFTLQT
jgi:uncharacterized protein with NRDE domain